MPSLFITADTISVRVHSERLVLLRRDSADHRDGAIEEINVPFHELDRIVICGCPVVTMPVFHKLMSLNIPVVFLSSVSFDVVPGAAVEVPAVVPAPPVDWVSFFLLHAVIIPADTTIARARHNNETYFFIPFILHSPSSLKFLLFRINMRRDEMHY